MTDTFSKVTDRLQSDVVAYIETLSSIEAVCLAGSMVHELTKMTGDPSVNPVQLRVSVSIYAETARLLLKRAVEQAPERPNVSVYAGFTALMTRVAVELNEAFAHEIGGER